MFHRKLNSMLYLSFGIFLINAACDGDKDDSSEISEIGPKQFASLPVTEFGDFADLEQQEEIIQSELKDLFCIHVYRLPLNSDFSQELSYLCEEQKPSAGFAQLDRLAALVGSVPKSVKLALEHSEDGFTHASFATVYRLPIEPKWVRSGEIYKFMTADSSYEYLNLNGEVRADHTDQLGGDLQFGKQELYYHTEVTTPDDTTFVNERTTELNSYQVHGGNPSIGIGAEHLLSSPENKYQTYNTITITIGNQDQGSTLITIIRLSVENNGYPELTEKVVSDIATAQATQVHDGLRASLQNRVIQP
ncbi:MAG: hypothetical protein ACOH5I_08415 [Oligoflexus sp.]